MSNFNPNNTISLDDGKAAYETKAQHALGFLASKGFVGNTQPPMVATAGGPAPYQGHIPPDLPSLDNTQLGHLMGLLSEWNHYVQDQLATASSNHTKAKAVLEHVEAQLRIAYQYDDNEKKRSNPERDDYMQADRRFVEAKSEVIYWDTIYTTIRAIANSAEQAFAAVSRRITQVGQEIERGNRTGHATGHSNINGSGPIFGYGQGGNAYARR